MNKRNAELGMLLAMLVLGMAVIERKKQCQSLEPNCDSNYDPVHDTDCDDNVEYDEADTDFDDFPVCYLSDIFRTREDDRIDDNLDRTSAQRKAMRQDLDSFIRCHSEDFDKIESTIGLVYKNLPADARNSFLDSVSDYCEMMKDGSQDVMLDALRRRFEI